MPEVSVHTTEYSLSVLTYDDPLRRHFTIKVQYRGKMLWAVTHDGAVLGRDNNWDLLEPSPSNREDDWLAAHRFTETEALERATHWAPLVTCNGRTAAQAVEWIAAQR